MYNQKRREKQRRKDQIDDLRIIPWFYKTSYDLQNCNQLCKSEPIQSEKGGYLVDIIHNADARSKMSDSCMKQKSNEFLKKKEEALKNIYKLEELVSVCDDKRIIPELNKRILELKSIVKQMNL